MNKQAYLENVYNSAFNDELRKIANTDDYDDIGMDLSNAGLYDKIYKPSFNKAEKAFESGNKGSVFGKNEWDYALSRLNKSKNVRNISKKYGKKITIVDTGPSEDLWKFKVE